MNIRALDARGVVIRRGDRAVYTKRERTSRWNLGKAVIHWGRVSRFTEHTVWFGDERVPIKKVIIIGKWPEEIAT